MSYFIVRESMEDRNVDLFLVDRKKTRSQWWTTLISLAIEYQKESAARFAARRLKYGNPRVINKGEALEISKLHESNCADKDHPFSSDGLGQR